MVVVSGKLFQLRLVEKAAVTFEAEKQHERRPECRAGLQSCEFVAEAGFHRDLMSCSGGPFTTS